MTEVKNCYVALLRGINVGGNNIIGMKELKECFGSAGFPDVRTYIQSGNVVFTASEEQGVLPSVIKSAIKETFGFEVPAMVKSYGQMKEIVGQRPAGFGEAGGDVRYDVFFFSDGVRPPDVFASMGVREGVDFVVSGSEAIYVTRLKGELTKSFMTRIISSAVYKDLTVRNWNTTCRLLGLMEKHMQEA